MYIHHIQTMSCMWYTIVRAGGRLQGQMTAGLEYEAKPTVLELLPRRSAVWNGRRWERIFDRNWVRSNGNPPLSRHDVCHCFSFEILALLPFWPLIPNLPSLGPGTHSLRAFLSSCQSSSRVLSLSISLFIRLFTLILLLFFPSLFSLVYHIKILANQTRSILFIHCAFDISLLTPRFPAHWPPYQACLFFVCFLWCSGPCLVAADWKIFFSLISNGRCTSPFFLDSR